MVLECLSERTYHVTVLQLHKFLYTLVLVDRVVISYDAFAVRRRLGMMSLVVVQQGVVEDENSPQLSTWK